MGCPSPIGVPLGRPHKGNICYPPMKGGGDTMTDEICTECGQRNPRGMFCPLSGDGEGPHDIQMITPTPTIKATPFGHLPGDDTEA